MASRPKGRRVLVKMEIPGGGKGGQKDATTDTKTVILRVKAGTAEHLDLTPLDKLPEGKTSTTTGVKHYRRGAKGTKSFTLILKAAATVGGVSVKTLDLPVPSTLSVSEFYEYAYANLKTKINGFISDDGMSYIWEGGAAAATP